MELRQGTAVLLALVAAGLGIVVVPASRLADDLAEGLA
jgi:DNA-binding transcriptional LysR family regulator